MSTSVPSHIAEARFRSLIDHLGAIVWEGTPGPRSGEAAFTFVSDGTETLLGYAPERWTADPRFWIEVIHPDDRRRVADQLSEAIDAREGADLVYRSLTADGREVWLRNIVRIQEDAAGVRLHGVVVDVTERHLADARLERLQALTDALSAMLSARDVAAVVAAHGRRAVGAVAVAVFLRVGDDELEISGYDGFPEEAIQEVCRIPLDHDVPAAEAVRTGVAITLTAEELVERYPATASWTRLAGAGRLVALPLQSGDRTLGALALRMASDRVIPPADRVVLDVLARSCAQALQRAETVAAEREADAVLDTIITTAPEGFALFDTQLRYVRVNDALATINGVPADEHVGRTLRELNPGVPEDGHEVPLRRVLETGEPVVDLEVSGYTAGDPEREHTWLISYYPVHSPAGAIAWLGAFVVDITDRKRAEVRARALAELGATLDDALTVEERLHRVVESLVPSIADVATASLHRANGVLERVASRHVNAEAESGIVSMGVPGRGFERTRRMDTGGPDSDESIRSGFTVPLKVRDRLLGVLALGALHSHAFDDEDIAFAEELARRVALGLDNAQLFEAERLARDRTERQYAVAAALADALTPPDVAGAILSEVVDAIGADQGTVWQVDEDGSALQLIGARGFSDDEMRGHQRVPMREPRPVADAIRNRAPVWFETAAEADAAYPVFDGVFARRRLGSILVMPLMSTGRAVGGLFLSSTRSYAFGPDERALAGALAAQAGQALERARLFEAERHVSVTLQRALLPAQLPDSEGLEVAVRYVPAAGLEAGGDFYEALPLPDGSLSIAVGDVVGRGAPAAAAMGQLRSALRAFALVGETPGAILARLSIFADTVGGAMAATAVVGRLWPETGEFRYACAGHPWPLLVHADGSAEYLLEGRGVPLACLAEPEYAEGSAQLRPGSTLMLYTDGLTERRGTEVEQVLERLLTAACETARAPLGELLDCALARSGDAAPADDVALVAVRLAGGGAERVLRFPADAMEVPGARGELRDWLGELGLDRTLTGDVLLAAGEAVANAVEHAGASEVVVRMSEPSPGVLSVVVADDGAWRPPVDAPHRGRGIGLMQALLDEVDIDRADRGTTVTLRHRFKALLEVTGHDHDGTSPAGTVPCAVEVADGVATVRGELDIAGAAEIRDTVLTARPTTVDLTAVDYLDSTGARLLLELAQALGHRLVVIATPGSVPRRALELSQFTELLDVRDA